MSGTDVGCAARYGPRLCRYAVCGYAAMRCAGLTLDMLLCGVRYGGQVTSAAYLRARYAIFSSGSSGTASIAIVLRARYAISGSAIAYDAIYLHAPYAIFGSGIAYSLIYLHNTPFSVVA
eukprot:2698302-Rhodomonas_salina.1